MTIDGEEKNKKGKKNCFPIPTKENLTIQRVNTVNMWKDDKPSKRSH